MKLIAKLGLALIAVTAGATCATAASTYPDRPIRLIVPFSAGGTSDVLARAVGQKLAEAVGQPVVVENRPGANGNIGSDAVAKAAPDGYTLLLAADGTMAINPTLYPDLPFSPEHDFAPITRVAVVPLVIVATPSLKANTIPELIELGKTQELDFGSAGAGSMGHLSGELLAHKTGMKMIHIPYKGGSQAVGDVVSGQIPLLITAMPVVDGLLKDGKLKAIAMTSAQRFAGTPDIPTVQEGGVAGYDSPSWYAIMAPAGTPAPILDKLQTDLGRILGEPAMKARLQDLGAIAVSDKREDFAKHLSTDIARWAETIKATNITIQ
ncbi:tripartite tricarboxylate transporter substrate binding protein [Bordetella sp. BOR01]|uniref:tripartite tricarboxylate transporter substrate binding protein n=1 Tax=Bordetella sp. BOR01 TaxID=2854779 RepID=UPI001C43DE3B|nr:tripartite tricarboxylate transporter substrate binding protein [Bordetella sp. BOR01]MBV7483390.1 tripartite tricarboxylate transporter substrate binding protein [Bordetella sp. BOR01]